MDVPSGSIVVGTDGSSSAEEAVRWAAARADAEDRPLTLLMALHPSTPAWQDPGSLVPAESHERALRLRGAEVLSQAHLRVASLFPDLEVREVFCLEDPREALIEASRTAHTMVVGSRGRGPWESLLLGSTSVAVVRGSSCPTVVHRPTPNDTFRQGVAVGAGTGTDSLVVLDYAFRTAALHRLPLTVVHSPAYDSGSTSSVLGPLAGGTAADRIEALTASVTAKAAEYPTVVVSTIVEEVAPERCLLDLADAMNLLVVGLHPRSRGAEFMFGSVSVWLVEHADCPVAVVPLVAA